MPGVSLWLAVAALIGDGGREIWIEKDRWLFLKVIQPGPGGTSTAISFNKYVQLGGGWIGTEVRFLRNGKEFFREVYRDWKINPAATERPLSDGALAAGRLDPQTLEPIICPEPWPCSAYPSTPSLPLSGDLPLPQP